MIKKISLFFLKLAKPRFYKKYIIYLLLFCKITILPVLFIGLYYSFIASPPDYLQGEMVRIMYIHVPCASLSLMIFLFMAICSFIHLVFKLQMAFVLTVSASGIGMLFAFLTLVTGSIWGYPVWGTWWVWDARLTSMFILFLSYVAYQIIIHQSKRNIKRSQKPSSYFVIISAINVPIVKYSVDIWNSLHQSSSILNFSKISLDKSMIYPLIFMMLFFLLYFVILLITKSLYILNIIKIQSNIVK